MKPIFLCLFALSVSLGIPLVEAEELVRLSLDESREGRGLYRITEDKASSEFEILSTEKGEWTPTYIILDTPCYKAGSLSPSGLWRFCAMDDLLSEDELERDTGLRADRSDSSLERPALSFVLPGRGGALFKQEDNLRQCALWGIISPSPYFNLELGQCLLLPEEDEMDESWFPGEKEYSDDPVYMSAADLNWDRSDSAFRIQAAASLSRYRKPSSSILPSWRFFFTRGEFLSRLWYSSPSWRGSGMETPVWHCLWDHSLILRFPWQATVLKAEASGAVQREGGFDGQCGISAELSPGPVELKLDAQLEYNSAEEGTLHNYGGRLYFYHGNWRESLSGEMDFEEKEPTGWSVQPGIRRSPRSGRYDKLSLDCVSEPGYLTLKPAAESSVPAGDFRIHIVLSYELVYTEEPLSSDEAEPFSCRITGEWKGR